MIISENSYSYIIIMFNTYLMCDIPIVSIVTTKTIVTISIVIILIIFDETIIFIIICETTLVINIVTVIISLV